VDGRVADDDDVVDDDGRRARGDLAVRGIDADAAIGAGARDGIPGLAGIRTAERRGIADDDRAGIVDGEGDELEAEAILQVDDAVVAEVRVVASSETMW
jgi:hypothetical protein